MALHGTLQDISEQVRLREDLLARGLRVTINSDDPAYFGGYVNENFVQIFQALGLDSKHAYQLAWNSFEASFVGEDQKRLWEHQLKAYFNGLHEQD